MLRIYLVRHGETDWNLTGRLQGQSDIPLNSTGLAQAERIADRLAAEPIDALWSSDLLRARQTADAIARRVGIEVRATPLLRERYTGDWEGLTREEISARGEAPVITADRQDTVASGPANAEPMEEVWDRLVEAARQARQAVSEGAVCLVGHGGSLRAILCDVLGADLTAMRRLWLDNGSLSLVEYSAGKQWVRLVNDTSHLR